jgi:hypothetical protein
MFNNDVESEPRLLGLEMPNSAAEASRGRGSCHVRSASPPIAWLHPESGPMTIGSAC